ncbi:hypothetical protein EX30DRAFT_376956 [Ascodesmis nigricans]|uniref:Uncharacterized protein n=1 Tax=Ascodesmis nigricans TaxID=341454 RepID=A0A4S2N7V7_9PEZI|nr:hypothetical protein EX30DRAFT_376956 [Ascodesmis nigricans]
MREGIWWKGDHERVTTGETQRSSPLSCNSPPPPHASPASTCSVKAQRAVQVFPRVQKLHLHTLRSSDSSLSSSRLSSSPDSLLHQTLFSTRLSFLIDDPMHMHGDHHGYTKSGTESGGQPGFTPSQLSHRLFREPSPPSTAPPRITPSSRHPTATLRALSTPATPPSPKLSFGRSLDRPPAT